VDSGSNVVRGNIACRCPWCGNNDPSEHMSINLEGRGFRCWRQPLHSGKNPAKLVQALLGCSWDQANQIAGQAKSLPNDFMNKVKQSLAKPELVNRSNNLRLPPEFKPFSGKPSCKSYILYLRRRGFNDKNILEDTKDYGIHYASQGNYKGRVIFIIEHEGKLVGWTGRTIYPNEMARYKTLSHDVEKAKENDEQPAPNPISHYLLWYDRIVNFTADTIVLCEGPFDAWRVNLLGEELGVVATCFFTSTLSKQQLNLLHGLLPRFKNRYLLLDENTFSKAARIRSDLVSLGVEVKRLPAGVKDPGEIGTVKQLQEILQ
jgi:hypothetical protein